MSLAQKLDSIKHVFSLEGRMGNTHYIDFLFPNEIPFNKVKGVDIFTRDFIILKVGIYDRNTKKLHITGQVFFQRYPKTELTHPSYFYNWQGGYLDGEFLKTGGGISLAQIKLLGDIIDNKIVEVKKEHRVCKYKNGDSKQIASMDYWEERAARIIQKQFLKCRYDPKYTICRNVVNRQFDEYNDSIH